MTKDEIVKEVSYREDVKKKDAEKIIQSAIAVVAEALGNGESIFIRGLGSLQIKNVAERKGRIIATGKQVIVPAHKVVRFSASKVVNEQLNK